MFLATPAFTNQAYSATRKISEELGNPRLSLPNNVRAHWGWDRSSGLHCMCQIETYIADVKEDARHYLRLDRPNASEENKKQFDSFQYKDTAQLKEKLTDSLHSQAKFKKMFG